MTVTIQGGAGADGLRTLARRVSALDPQALVRFQPVSSIEVDAFCTTPFGVLASRRLEGHVGEGNLCVSAADLAAAVNPEDLAALQERPVGAWPGALPPAGGFELVEVLPADEVYQLATQGKNLARQFSGPLGPPASLLDQTVVRLHSESGASAEINMRMIFAITSLGLLPGLGVRPDLPHVLRVSTRGRWVRVDAPFGSVYRSKGLPLAGL